MQRRTDNRTPPGPHTGQFGRSLPLLIGTFIFFGMAAVAIGQQPSGAPARTPPEPAQPPQSPESQSVPEPTPSGADELTELQRQRLREQYIAALEAQERQRMEGGQQGDNLLVRDGRIMDELIDELLRQRREIGRIPRQTQTQLQQLQQMLGDQQKQVQEQLDKVRDQMQEIDRRLADLTRQATPTPQAGQQPLQDQAARQRLEEEFRRDRAIEAAMDRIDRRQQELYQYLQVLDRDLRSVEQQQEQIADDQDYMYRYFGGLRDTVQALRRQIAPTQQQPPEKQQAQERAAQPEWRKQQEQLMQRLGLLEKRLAEERAARPRADELQKRVAQLEEQVKAAGLTQMQQRIERLEPAKVELESALRAQIGSLQGQVSGLQKDLVQTQALVNAMLCQTGRSTVGSAGYTWGW